MQSDNQSDIIDRQGLRVVVAVMVVVVVVVVAAAAAKTANKTNKQIQTHKRIIHKEIDRSVTHTGPELLPHSSLMACKRGKGPSPQWEPEKSSRGKAHTITPPKLFCFA